MDNKKPLPPVEEHVGEQMQCEDAWHADVKQLREMIVLQRQALACVQQAMFDLLPNGDGRLEHLTGILDEPLPWIE